MNAFLKNEKSFSDFRSSPPELFLGKGALKLYSKFTQEHPCGSVISTKLQNNFIEIKLCMGALL